MAWYWPFKRASSEVRTLAAPPSASLTPGPTRAPSEAPIVPPPTSEAPPVETIVINPWRKLSRIYPADGITPERFKAILRAADVGFTWELMELLDDVSADPDFGPDLRTRKLGVAGAPYTIKPGDDSDLGRRIADDYAAFLDRVPNFTQMKMDLLDAPYRGFACVQPKWTAARIKGAMRWEIADWEAIESRFFRFDQGDVPAIETLEQPSGARLPEGVIFHSVRDKAGTMVRGGMGRTLAKLWIYKSYATVDAASFLERFGHPYVTLEIGLNIKEDSPELARAKRAAMGLMTEQVGLLPPGATLKFLDNIGKSSTFREMYLAFISWAALAGSKTILGHTASTNMGESTFGHGAESQRAGDLQQGLKEYDARGVEQTLNRQLGRPWTTYHYGPDAPAPLIVTEVGIPEDEQANANARKTEAETLAVLNKDLRLTLSEAQLREKFEANKPLGPEDTIGPPAPPPAPPQFRPPGAPGALPPELEASAHAGYGACPHCSQFFKLEAAEKKKRSLLEASTR